VGFSLGTTQMFYGMAYDDEGFFENNVSAFAALAPCTKLTNTSYSFMSMGSAMYDRVMEV